MKFVSVIISGFFISLHFGTTLYLNSTLLENFFDPALVSLLFVIGALGNIVLFLFAPKIIRLFGKRILLLSALLLSGLATLTLSMADNAALVTTAFLVHASFFFVTYYCLDIFLEEWSTDKKTGEIRGIYLTVISLGVACGPLVFSFLTNISNDLGLVYLVSSLFLIPAVLLAISALSTNAPHKHHPYHHSAKLPFLSWWSSVNVRRTTLARFILEAFYTFMFIYTPVYLTTVVGFSLSELGVLFTVMLLPFILFEWMIGEVSDRWWGEKEIMITGFIIMILALMMMPYVGHIFIAWMAILFFSRVGACFVEVTTESYFFKQIDSSDTALISIFRLARPASIVLGALLGTLALSALSFDKIFLVLAIVVVIGLRESVVLKDTR